MMGNVIGRILGLGGIRLQLHIPIEIVAPAFWCIANADGDGNDGAPARLHRTLLQLHAGFFRRPSAFAVVAAPTGGHDILPRLLPPLGDGHHMIKRQFFGPKLAGTVLATVPVSRKNIDAGKFDGAMTVLQFDQLQQSHHRWQLDRQ